MEKTAHLKQIKYSLILVCLFILNFSNGCTKDNMDNMSGGNTDGTGTGAKPGTNEVWMQGTAFTPETLTVTSGTTITWTNKDGALHTVTSDTGLFDSGNINVNGTFTFKFNNPGTYLYHCSLHTSMNGKVIVN
jgi:plastocyanin